MGACASGPLQPSSSVAILPSPFLGHLEDLQKEKTTSLYHQTSPEAAASILKEGFKLGLKGACGGGIYFATNPKDTDRKAKHRGTILKAQVVLGKTIVLGRTEAFSLISLVSRGYSSIRLTAFHGDEYVIFNPLQIRSVECYSSSSKLTHPTFSNPTCLPWIVCSKAIFFFIGNHWPGLLSQ